MKKIARLVCSLAILSLVLVGGIACGEEKVSPVIPEEEAIPPAEEEAIAVEETVEGTIEALDVEASSITIAGKALTVTDATVVDKDGTPCSLGDLEVGMKVSATYNPDTMEVAEIQATSAEAPAEEIPTPEEVPTW